ncbi:type II secretion protein F [Streptomyces sp. NPDC102360]|uniref:type II secretion protein F n=1 Tax=Streptomyces sp. NPDC102360 TaxID=3366160 RepID=UPI0038008E2E
MTWFVVPSIGLGIGLWALAVWLVPSRPPLSALVTRLNTIPAARRPRNEVLAGGGWATHLGRPFVHSLSALGLPTQCVRRDLGIAGRSVEKHLAEKAALAVTGLCLPMSVGVALAAGGHPLPWPIPSGGALVLAAGGFLLPDVALRTEAERRRAAFRHALGCYLNLIHILLAGGAGVEGALMDAADMGEGWSFRRLRSALNAARLTRTSPWETLGQLGEELDVGELAELAGALSLAGTEGARVRASLAAKASALRSRGAADAEGRANAATERMALPGMLMAFGFVLFVFYPALFQINASL